MLLLTRNRDAFIEAAFHFGAQHASNVSGILFFTQISRFIRGSCFLRQQCRKWLVHVRERGGEGREGREADELHQSWRRSKDAMHFRRLAGPPDELYALPAASRINRTLRAPLQLPFNHWEFNLGKTENGFAGSAANWWFVARLRQSPGRGKIASPDEIPPRIQSARLSVKTRQYGIRALNLGETASRLLR